MIGTAPEEGHDDREAWIETYTELIPQFGLRLEGGPDPRGYAQCGVGFAVDQPRFVLPDGGFIPTRLTAVLRQETDRWKVVHLHFSVGVPEGGRHPGAARDILNCLRPRRSGFSSARQAAPQIRGGVANHARGAAPIRHTPWGDTIRIRRSTRSSASRRWEHSSAGGEGPVPREADRPDRPDRKGGRAASACAPCARARRRQVSCEVDRPGAW